VLGIRGTAAIADQENLSTAAKRTGDRAGGSGHLFYVDTNRK